MSNQGGTDQPVPGDQRGELAGGEPARAAAPAPRTQTVPRTPTGEKIGRNDPCFCGSGKKYKQCHGR